MAVQPGTRLGPYEILSAIGAGGMGEVYRARDSKLGRDVAIKVLPGQFAHDTERLARFQREAKMLAALNHPNIATIYGFEQSGSMHCLVMELVEGPTLADRIRAGAIPIDESLPIARQIADAIECAHDQNVIHRDLKPANIKVKPDGTVKVLDFGLAKAMSAEVSNEDIANSPTLSMAATRQGIILGTAAYMSPEQAKGKSVDRRTDVWAFGCVLYEMLAGKQAFAGEDVTDILASVMKSDPSIEALPGNTPAAIRTLLQRCTDKNIKRRMQHIGEARIILEDVLSGAGKPASEEKNLESRRARDDPRYKVLAAVAAVALMAAIGLAGWIVFMRRSPAPPVAARFSIDPPADGAFSTFPSFLTVSPDGSKIAFIASGMGKPPQLWIRSLDSETAQALAGTENPDQPFWSADGKFLAFYADNKLKKVNISGGPAQTLTDAPLSSDQGDWNRDGVILFAPRGAISSSVIYRISANGGKPAPVTTLDAGRGENAHSWPHFLPDGKHFLYTARSANPENNAIYVGSIDSHDTKRLLNAFSSTACVEPGYLLFDREGTLMAQAFDANRMTLSGDEIPLAEELVFNSTNGKAAFTASRNGVLAYRSGASSTQLVWADRSGKQTAVLGDPDRYFSLALSPDGKRAAVSIRDNQNGDIWIFDVARNLKTRFTFDPGNEQEMAWSPDGSVIAFNSNKKGMLNAASQAGTLDLYSKASDGSGEETLLYEDTFNKYPAGWTADGQSLLFGTGGGSPKTGADLFVLPLGPAGKNSNPSGQMGKPVPLLQTQFNEIDASFSPDSRWVAYSSNEAGSGRYEIYVMPYPGSGGKKQISTEGGLNPRWKRDGTELFFLSADGTKMMVAQVNGKGSSFEVGEVKELFATSAFYGYYRYDVTADGQHFLINSAAQHAATPISVMLNWTSGLKK